MSANAAVVLAAPIEAAACAGEVDAADVVGPVVAVPVIAVSVVARMVYVAVTAPSPSSEAAGKVSVVAVAPGRTVVPVTGVVAVVIAGGDAPSPSVALVADTIVPVIVPSPHIALAGDAVVPDVAPMLLSPVVAGEVGGVAAILAVALSPRVVVIDAVVVDVAPTPLLTMDAVGVVISGGAPSPPSSPEGAGGASGSPVMSWGSGGSRGRRAGGEPPRAASIEVANATQAALAGRSACVAHSEGEVIAGGRIAAVAGASKSGSVQRLSGGLRGALTDGTLPWAAPVLGAVGRQRRRLPVAVPAP